MDPVSTVVELSPEIVALIQQIIENQSDDITAENLQAISDSLYCEVEDENGEYITVSVAQLLSLQNQQLLELKEQQAIIDKRLDSEFLTLNDGIGVLGVGVASVLCFNLIKHIFGGSLNV